MLNGQNKRDVKQHYRLPIDLELKVIEIWKTIKDYAYINTSVKFREFREHFLYYVYPDIEVLRFEKFTNLFKQQIKDIESFSERKNIYLELLKYSMGQERVK